MNKPISYVLPEDHYMEYNGIRVHWFIGDLNSKSCWEAWGSCLGKAYQLFAWYNRETKELTEICVNKDNGSSYFSQENYNLLTK